MIQHPTALLQTRPRSARQPGFLDRTLAAWLADLLAPVDVGVQLWDGYSGCGVDRRPTGTLRVGDRPTLLGLVFYPDFWFGEAYSQGRLAVHGDLEQVIEALCRVTRPVALWRHRLRAALAPVITRAGARRNAQSHYDVGNDFYRLWLDDQMVYTCAYFPDAAASIEEAQRCKLELVCRKLQLRPGERVLETGSGWGAMALHMAREHGVSVTAYNVSHEQVVYARQRAVDEGLGDRVTFIEDDYRTASGSFDAFVSLGMLEHVGRRQFDDLAGVLRRSIRRDGGRGLLHFIGTDSPRPLNAWIRRRIFPGAYTPTLPEVAAKVLVPAGMSVVDVENLRLHYARTLRHWRQRFTSARAQIDAEYGASFGRAWELYLAGSEASFATGWLQLFQVVFSPAESAPPFWTRADIYDRPLGAP